jgi:hypothetical protein
MSVTRLNLNNGELQNKSRSLSHAFLASFFWRSVKGSGFDSFGLPHPLALKSSAAAVGFTGIKVNATNIISFNMKKQLEVH